MKTMKRFWFVVKTLWRGPALELVVVVRTRSGGEETLWWEGGLSREPWLLCEDGDKAE